jgi:ABC-2 type transport system permease protein
LRLFFKMIGLNVKVFLQHRKGFLMSLLIHPIVLIFNILLFKAIFAYNETDVIKGYSLSQMVWYFAATVLVWVFIWNFTDSRMSERILSGDLALDLLRPVRVIRVELAHAAGLRITALMIEFIPDFLVYSLIYFPDFLTPAAAAKFLASITLSFFLFFFISFLIGLSSFITMSNRSLGALRIITISLLGGGYFPLEFMPQWFIRVTEFLPFQYIFYWPIQFFLNTPTSQSLDVWYRTIAYQLLWIALLYVCCTVTYRSVIRKFCSAGG